MIIFMSFTPLLFFFILILIGLSLGVGLCLGILDPDTSLASEIILDVNVTTARYWIECEAYFHKLYLLQYTTSDKDTLNFELVDTRGVCEASVAIYPLSHDKTRVDFYYEVYMRNDILNLVTRSN